MYTSSSSTSKDTYYTYFLKYLKYEFEYSVRKSYLRTKYKYKYLKPGFINKFK